MPGFSKSNRLLLKKDFHAVFSKARKITYKNMLVLYCPNQKNFARLGIIIKKQDVKLAVHRNRYRRLIRESFRHSKESLKGLDLIVIMRSECNPDNVANFRDEIAQLWLNLSKK